MAFPKSLTTVTPFSKYIAMFLFVFFPFVFSWVGYQYGYSQKILDNDKLLTRISSTLQEEKNINPLKDYYKKVDIFMNNTYLRDPYIALGTELGKNLYVNDTYNFQFVLPPNSRYFDENNYYSIKENGNTLKIIHESVENNKPKHTDEIILSIYPSEIEKEEPIAVWWEDNLSKIEPKSKMPSDYITMLNPKDHIRCIQDINNQWKYTVYAVGEKTGDQLTTKYYIPMNYGKPFVLSYSITSLAGLDGCASSEINLILASFSQKIVPRYQ